MKTALCVPLMLGVASSFTPIGVASTRGASTASRSLSSQPTPSSDSQPVDSVNHSQNEASVDVEDESPSQAPPPPPPPVSNLPPSSNDFKAVMAALGTSPRRIFLSTLSASGIALAGNFLGVTSRFLTAVPEDVVEASYLDTYFPRGNFKRCRGQGYTFVIPSEWLADTFVELAKAQRRIQPLDYSMSSGNAYSSNRKQTLPDAAYGPPGRLNQKGVSESGDTNVSVIVTGGLNNFSLPKALGGPQEGAEYLLRVSIAPEGSGRRATLLNAFEDESRSKAYQFEYLVERSNGAPPLRNISVVAVNNDATAFYTLTVVAPASEWERSDYDAKLRKIAQSFHLTG